MRLVAGAGNGHAKPVTGITDERAKDRADQTELRAQMDQQTTACYKQEPGQKATAEKNDRLPCPSSDGFFFDLAWLEGGHHRPGSRLLTSLLNNGNREK